MVTAIGRSLASRRSSSFEIMASRPVNRMVPARGAQRRGGSNC